MTITGTTQLIGLIGDPVAHSLSPDMHNRAIAALGLDYVYVPFPVKADDLGTAIAGLAALGVVGFNVTIPHKQAVMPHLDIITPVAEAIGAVNTVWRSDRGWEGTNTDVTGFLAPLRDRATTAEIPYQRPLVLLGHGGAARAVVAGARQLGCPVVHVVGRNPEKVEAFVRSWDRSPIAINLQGHPFDNLATLLPEAGMIVNATPLGMHPHTDRSPLPDTLVGRIASDAIAYDLIYTPSPTRFLMQAQGQGAIAIGGLDMLVGQGAAALERWIGQAPPIEIMRQALRSRLGLDS